MAYSLITKGVAGSSDGNTFTSSTFDTTGANLIEVVLTWFGASEPALSDSLGNLYTALAAAQNNGADRFVRQRYVYAPAVGSGHTFTLTGTGFFGCLAFRAWSGAASSPADQANGGSATATTVQPGSVTPTEANELVVTGLVWDPSETASIDGGFTISDQLDRVASQHVGIAAAYLIQGAAAAVNPTWTVSPDSTSLGANIHTYKAVAGGSPGTLGYLRPNRLRPRIFGPGLAR